jgi:hypothetical protein
LNIKPRGTDVDQALNLVVFGTLKATGRAEHRKSVHENLDSAVNTNDVVTMLLHALDHLSIGAVENAWKVFRSPYNGDEADMEARCDVELGRRM